MVLVELEACTLVQLSVSILCAERASDAEYQIVVPCESRWPKMTDSGMNLYKLRDSRTTVLRVSVFNEVTSLLSTA